MYTEELENFKRANITFDNKIFFSQKISVIKRLLKISYFQTFWE